MKLQRNGRTKAIALGAVAVVSTLTLAACGSDNNNSNAGSSTSAAASTGSKSSCSASGLLNASGSTAQANAINAWIKGYAATCPSVQVNYMGGGSSTGRADFAAGTVAFAGSDAAMVKADAVLAAPKGCSATGTPINIPLAAGPIAIAFNVSGVTSLNLDASTLAQIFAGKITNWNDAAIAKLNPSAKLPDLKITTFHRSDGSGTSANFSAYLAAAAPSDWKYGSNSAWPAPGGQSAQGSSGLEAEVAKVPGAISYYELSYAKAANQTTASIVTSKGGTPVAATTDAAAKAIAEAKPAASLTGSADEALSLAYNTTTAGDYPIALVTYEIVCDKGNNPKSLAALKGFLTYAASDAGQQAAAAAGYSALPSAILTKAQQQIAALA